MRAIGFNFTKISIEKLKATAENIKINSELDVPELKPIKSDILKTKDEILEAKFRYKIKYEPEFAKVEMEGTILLSVDHKAAKDILAQWKKKGMQDETNIFLYNIITRKATPKALALEDDLNLPLHIPLPMMRKNKEK